MAFEPGRPLGSALAASAELEAAHRMLDDAGLRRHPTPTKDWDLALFHARLRSQVPRGGRILDAGCAKSPLLRNLVDDGWRDLWGIDFDLTGMEGLRHPDIQYVRGNLMRSPFPDASFDAIACQSVVEHGCRLDVLFREMARLLRPGGVLLLSTDYWPWPQSTRHVSRDDTFGLPWRIFSAVSLRRLRWTAAVCGFRAPARWDYGAGKRLIEWNGRRYTFFAAELVRRG